MMKRTDLVRNVKTVSSSYSNDQTTIFGKYRCLVVINAT